MKKFPVVIALVIVSFCNENLAWKSLNSINFMETKTTSQHSDSCLPESQIANGLYAYFMNALNLPKPQEPRPNNNVMKIIVNFFSICENSVDPVRCYGIEALFGLHIANLTIDEDLESLHDFEKEICARMEEKDYCLDCKNLFRQFPKDLFLTDFVKNFISKTDSLLTFAPSKIAEIWEDPYTKYIEKHSEKICSFVCPTSV